MFIFRMWHELDERIGYRSRKYWTVDILKQREIIDIGEWGKINFEVVEKINKWRSLSTMIY